MVRPSLICLCFANYLRGPYASDARCPKVTVHTEPCPLCESESSCESGRSSPQFLNYFAKLSNQQNMMKDQGRTNAYRHAITSHADVLDGKVVMDVGAGTGILGFFAAQAGASRVHAVEPTSAAETLRVVAASPDNFYWGSRVQTHAGLLDDVHLPPSSVDAIASECFGPMLFTEFPILSAYLQARDRFLKPNGLMFPQSASLSIVMFSDAGWSFSSYRKLPSFWSSGNYGVDWSAALPEARRQTWSALHVTTITPKAFVGETHQIEFDLRTLTMDKLENFTLNFGSVFESDTTLHGLVSWFDVGFPNGTGLSTSPYNAPTHWKQSRLLLKDPLMVSAGRRVRGELRLNVGRDGSYIAFVEICSGSTIPVCAESEVIDVKEMMWS